jgi:signal peptidase I
MSTALGVAPVVLLLLVAGGVALLRHRFSIITVLGESMAPTYRPGDRLVVRRRRSAVQGDAVVFTAPAQPGLMVKRVAAVPGDVVPAGFRTAVSDERVPAGRLLVLGDNPASLDSRLLGYIAAATVVGVVTRPFGTASPRPPR